MQGAGIKVEGHMADNNEIKVKSLQKAMEILNYFTEKQVLGVTEISEHFDICKSTVHNVLSTLNAMEWSRMMIRGNTGWEFKYST